MKFLAIGECMIELAPQSGDLYAMNFAGDTFNTAWYLRRAAGDAVEVIYCTALGDDQPSLRMRDFFVASGITPLVKMREKRSVGLYMVSLKDGERSFSYWRDAAAARTLADDLEDLPLAAGDIAYFSGITLAILPEAGRRKLLDVLAQCKTNGVQVAFDPNLRPRLWDDVQTMCDWTMKGAAVADICLPSFEDEADYFGDGSPADTCARYAAQGTALIVVKNGPGEILVSNGHTQVTVMPTPADTIVDTTAAGDSFNAQFLLSHMQGETLEDATKAACNLSRRVISKLGALVD